jgi:hypothetical protein
MAGFLVEFTVAGEPVSLQTRNKAAKTAWMTLVTQASIAGHPRGSAPYPGAVRVAIYYFSAAPMVGDIDNIVKPILDALCNRVYVDDHQVATVLVRKIEPGQATATTNPSPTLVSALTGMKPLVYIHISDDPGGEPL